MKTQNSLGWLILKINAGSGTMVRTTAWRRRSDKFSIKTDKFGYDGRFVTSLIVCFYIHSTSNNSIFQHHDKGKTLGVQWVVGNFVLLNFFFSGAWPLVLFNSFYDRLSFQFRTASSFKRLFLHTKNIKTQKSKRAAFRFLHQEAPKHTWYGHGGINADAIMLFHKIFYSRRMCNNLKFLLVHSHVELSLTSFEHGARFGKLSSSVEVLHPVPHYRALQIWSEQMTAVRS